MKPPLYRKGFALGMLAAGVALGAGWAALPARGEDGQVWWFGGGATNLDADLVVGDTGTNNTLIIDGGGMVSNREAVIGNSSSAGMNSGVVQGPSSMWISAGTLAVGNYGPGNSLTITNGGMVSNAIGAIGAWAPSSGNILMVAGSNSQWLGSYDLLAGYEGNTNRLCLSAGGRLSAAYTTIGEAPAAIGNTAIATDSGTLLTNAWALIVGHCGSANTLLVTNAARVAHRYGFIGVETNAGGNQVTVAGACWTTFSNLTIGVDGHDNALMIVNSGQVRSAVGILGDYDDGIGNQVIISGAGALWTNSGTLTVGNDGSGNQVVITNDGQLVCAASMIGYGPHAGGNAVVLTGTNAMWSGFTNLVIGNGGTGNIVRISQGAFLTNRQTWIGFTVTAAS